MGTIVATDVATAAATRIASGWQFKETALQSVYLRMVDEVPCGPPGIFKSKEEAIIALKDESSFFIKMEEAFLQKQEVLVKINLIGGDTFIITRG